MPLCKVCSYPGCSAVVPYGVTHCEKHAPLAAAQREKYLQAQQRRREARRTRERGSSSARGYNYRWQKARRTFLFEHPLCEECLKRGEITAATDVDHIKPHKGDSKLFWDTSNWQALCHRCHSRKTVLEDGGFNNPVK